MRSLYLFLCFILFDWFLLATSPQDFIQQAMEQLSQGNRKEAIQLCLQCLENKDLAVEVRFELGKLLIRCGEVEQGFVLLTELVQIRSDFETHRTIADLASIHRKLDLALEHYKSALKIKETASIHRVLASLYEEQGKYDLSLQHRSLSVSMEMPKIRGLKFKKPVMTLSKNREELKKFLLEEIERTFPEQKARDTEDALKIFGLIPETCNMKQTIIKVLTEEIGGFYDSTTKKLYLITEPKKSGSFDKILSWQRDDSEERGIISHEMTHALQDQYYGIDALQKPLEENDDRLLAFQALLEGDAMISMMDYNSYPNRLMADDIPAIRFSMGMLSFLLPVFEGKELRQAPRVLKESLLFPYMEGLTFCLSLRESKIVWQNINACYRRLPSSTEHILHPDKYLKKEPVWDCQIPDYSKVFGDGWVECMNNVVGEFTCRLLFQQYQIGRAEKIAEGWGGDRYSVLRHESGNRALVWATHWDTTNDAKEFFSGYRELLKKKYPNLNWKEQPQNIQAEFGNTMISLDRYHQRVWVMEQIPKDSIEAIRRKLSSIQFQKK